MKKPGMVLIVDDEQPVRDALYQQLTRAGYACETAAEARAALDRLRSADFDVVLVDLQMPEMDGFQLLAAMRESHPSGEERLFFRVEVID